ncbi:TlpA family protein disulfide reductase [Hymenobacter sp. RP-2-7]|uniref:TlpA family protein disulfide reductase n=1 Tax=Hymenobacter polaris TaxID=2682546 RepID=A0A7Y0FPL7_9BACT|nr:TlpA disulfide reductase family protein [Hymenobacter polaris]NML67680.1 TlpA family protein disulfide reductase [Hymenobacter polaris]
MKQTGLGVVVASILGLAACGPGSTTQGAAALAAAEKAKVDSLTHDFRTWYEYAYYQVPLGQPFVGLDTAARPLARPAFLERLRTGRFIALQLKKPAGSPTLTLKLCPLPAGADPEIAATSKQLADIELDHYLLEGKLLPAFDFRDLNGRRYTPANTRGKVLVLKTWFINCTACVKEFPEVNALADQYKANPDVVFVSLALDNADYLQAFLTNQPLRYAVVPKSEDYIAGSLRLSAYPTHLVVGRDGKVVKVSDRVPDLVTALARVVPPPGR